LKPINNYNTPIQGYGKRECALARCRFNAKCQGGRDKTAGAVDGMGWVWTYGWGPGRALSAVSCLMDISREEELAFEIQMAGELVIPLRLSAAITWGNSSLRLR